MSSSKATQQANQTQTTTQTDSRIGASDSAVALRGDGTAIGAGGTNIEAGGAITIESVDPEVIAQSLGLSRDVATQLATFAIASSEDSTAVAREALERGFDFGSDVSADVQDTAREALQSVSRANTESLLFADRNSALTAQSFETFGTELSKVKEAQVTGNESLRAKTQQTLIIAGSVASVIVAGIYVYTQFKKKG